MSENIDKKIKKTINLLSNNRIDEELITNDTQLFKDLGFDSIMLVQLIAYLEDEFNIIFEDEELEMGKLSHYKNIKNMVIEKVSAKM